MKARYRVIGRGSRGGAYYCVDTTTGEQTSPRITDEGAARKVVYAKNEVDRQPALNLPLAKACLAGTDGAMATRTRGDALPTLTNTK